MSINEILGNINLIYERKILLQNIINSFKEPTHLLEWIQGPYIPLTEKVAEKLKWHWESVISWSIGEPIDKDKMYFKEGNIFFNLLNIAKVNEVEETDVIEEIKKNEQYI